MFVKEIIREIVGVTTARERGGVGYDLRSEEDLRRGYEQRVDGGLVNQYVSSEVREVEASVVV